MQRIQRIPFFVGVLIAVLGGPLVVRADPTGINGGELHFLTHVPADAGILHHQIKHITILPDSLKTGWVAVRQCHFDLDAVPALQVVFGKGLVRALTITRADHIGRAWIDGDTVQLADVRPHAVLCLRSENHVLRHFPRSNRYLLVSGPFMRRFLDGYFPMRVDVDVDYPRALTLAHIDPPGMSVSQQEQGRLKLNAVFEGRLMIGVQFEPAPLAPDSTLRK